MKYYSQQTVARMRSCLFLLGLVMLIILFELTVNRPFVGSDDAYIHLRYIENIRSGHGFGFNPDEPSNGCTSPLWVLLAASMPGNSSLLPTVKYLSVFLFGVSVIVFYLLIFRWTASTTLAVLATCIYTSDAWLLKWAGSAMESSLASLLALSATLFLVRSNKTSNLVLTSAILGLATLVRPEFLLLFFLFLVLTLTHKGNFLVKTARGTVALATYVTVLSPWLLFAWLSFGSPIPNTFFAKTLASETTAWQVGWYFVRVIGLSYWWTWFTALLKMMLLLRESRQHKVLLSSQDKAITLLWLWCAAIPAFYTISRLQTPSTRYLQITTPILIAVASYTLFRTVTTQMRNTGRRWHPNLVLSLSATSIVVFNIALNILIVLPSNRDFSEGVLQTYQEVGEWLRDNTPENSRIAVAIDVGAIGYYSNRKIIDLGGLNTPEVIPYLPNGLNYVFVSKPDYLVVTGERSKYALINQSRFEELASPILSLPIEVGSRGALDRATAGFPQEPRYVSVYRLLWQ